MRYKTILLLVLSAWGIMACQNYTDKIAVEIRQPVYPVLTLKEHNPVLCLRLIRNSGVAYQLEKINFTLDGTVRSGDVVSASLFLDKNCGQVCASAKPVNKQLSFKVGRQIEEDTLTINRKTFCDTFSNRSVSVLQPLTQNEMRFFICFST